MCWERNGWGCSSFWCHWEKRYFRPTEVDLLIGDVEKAYKELGWKTKTNFKSLARIMAKADYEKVKKRGF